MRITHYLRYYSPLYPYILIICLVVGISTCLYSMGRTPTDESELREIFDQTVEEELQPTKWDSGNTTISNEHRIDLFFKYIKNKGGGYIGVGTTQNFTLASVAKAEWIWLVDFTKIVAAANKIHIAFLKKSKTPRQFSILWEDYSRKKAHKIIREEYPKLKDYSFIFDTWRRSKRFVRWRFKCLRYISRKRRYKTWFTDIAMYNHIRDLAIRGHIKSLKGNLNGTTTMESIAEIADKMDVPIRVIYLSNAEEFFKSYTPQFKENINELPVDDNSILIRTATIYKWFYPWAPDSDYQNSIGFHYNVMPVSTFKAWLSMDHAKLELHHLLKSGKVIGKTGLSIISSPPKSN